MTNTKLKSVDYDPFRDGEIQSTVPSTASQQEIWTSIQMASDAELAFNESVIVRVPSMLEPALVRAALGDLSRQHDALRTCFSPLGKTLLITAYREPTLTVIDLRGQDQVRQDARIAELRRAACQHVFDLARGHLYQLSLVQLESETLLILTAHHVVCDGWSLAILIKDLARFYTARQEGHTLPPSAGMHFSAYAQREHERSKSAANVRNEQFWSAQFQNLPPPMDLPMKGPRPTFRSFHADRYDVKIPMALWTASKQASAKMGCSHLAYMLSLFHVLISRLSMQRDVVSGIPAAGQSILGQYGLVGHCVNLLPIRATLAPEDTFATVVQRTKKLLLDAYDHQEYTFGSLLQQLRIERDPSRLPIVSVLFNIDQQLESKDLSFGGSLAHYESNPRFAENFELFVNISESKERVILECQYNTDLFSLELVQTFFRCYISLLEQLDSRSQDLLRTLPLLDDPRQIIQWNQTLAPYPKDQTLDGILLPLIKSRGTREVCRTAQDQLNGDELHELAQTWAQLLREQGVKRGDRVGLCMQRKSAMLAAVLAIWQVGAAYVPLDPTFPLDRLHYMIDDAGIRVCLTQSDLRHLLPAGLRCLESDKLPRTGGPLVRSEHNPDDVAYVIYTSGSTGRPKGVMIQHRPVINFLFGVQKQLQLGADDRLLAVTTLSFDISVLELYLPLLTGAALYIASSDEARDGDRLQAVIAEHKISCMQATPSTWRVLLGSGLKPVRPLQALCGGEAFPQDLARDLARVCAKVWNMYGPTEATVWATMYQVADPEKPILIGRPLQNCQLYVLNADMQLQPPGVKGDLYIGGECLALGYLNRPELTGERFIEKGPQGLGRLYQTGDLARFTFDGQLEIFGRSDDQVKVRGYRIELGEIEKVIARHPAIKVALVIVREDQPGDKRLVAYFETRTAVTVEELRAFAAETLPEYMLPQHMIALDRLPLLPNGKMDRKSLPSPQASRAQAPVGVAYVPVDAMASSFHAIWTSTLGVTQAQENDNFFITGGHSLLAIQMVARLNRDLNCQLQMRDVFVHPTFAQLLAHVRGQVGKGQKVAAITVRGDKQKAQLSLLQQRMWYLEQLDPETRVHNLPGAWEIKGVFDPETFRQAFARLMDRHEALRSTLVTRGDGAEVNFHDEAWLPLVRDLTREKEPLKVCQNDMNQRALEKLSLDSFPLYQCVIYKIAPESHVLFFMVHHAIWDGWCFDLFLKEMGLHYRSILTKSAIELPALPVQYYDFAAWHRNAVEKSSKPEDLAFWVKTLTPIPEPLEIPTDYPRPPLQSHKGLTLVFKIPEAELRACEALAKKANVTLFSLYLACYKLLLQRFSRQHDIVVGVPLRGRQQTELENILGLFINVLPVRTAIKTEESFLGLAQRVHQNCMDAFAHGDVLLESIVAALNLKRDDSRTPLYSAMFSYQDVTDRVQTLAGFEMKQLGVSSDVVHTDQMLWMKRGTQYLEGGVDFRSDLWDRQSMENFRDCLCAVIRQLGQIAQQTIGAVDILPDALRKDLLETKSSAARLPHRAPLSQLLDLSRFRPEREAVVSGAKRLTYGDLHTASHQLAHHLVRQGVKAGDRIGICLHRHADLVTAMLAILQVGAAYVPMDPNYPAERLTFMLNHSQARVVLTESDLVDLVPRSQAELIVIDEAAWRQSTAALPPLKGPHDEEGPAYLIYTSGSTGQPKGVVVSRRALTNFLQGISLTMGLDTDDRILGLTTISFDISILEIFGSLSLGACLVLIDQETSLDGAVLAKVLQNEKVSVMQATPASWRLLLSAGWTGQKQMKAICGGEALPKDLAAALVDRCAQLWNAYGPTEATVWATLSHVADAKRPILIGRPLPGYRAYILDEQQNLQAPGVWGNLFLGGESLADGYYRQEGLTAERFVSNPFVASEKMYDTGDIARLRWDGQLEFSSRRDNQVKVRGFRIELGEIETHLSAHTAVDKAVVIVREDKPDDKRLVAYVVCHARQELTAIDMQKFLSLKLPKYMLPNHLVLLPKLPLTDNGKVDRKALPPPQEIAVTVGELPQTEAEKVVALIWSELLNVSDIRREHMFFDLGGHSLLSIQVVNRINQISQRPLKLRDLLTGTLAQVAALCVFPDASSLLRKDKDMAKAAN